MKTRWLAGFGMMTGAAMVLLSADNLTRTLTRLQQGIDALQPATLADRHALGPTLRTHLEPVLSHDGTLLLGIVVLMTSYLIFRRSRITIAPPGPAGWELPPPAPPRDE